MTRKAAVVGRIAKSFVTALWENWGMPRTDDGATKGTLEHLPDDVRSGLFDLFDEVHRSMERTLAALEPGAASGEDAAVGVALFSVIKNMAAAGEALCAARVAETRHWRLSGDRTPAHWFARTTGSSMGEALAAVQVPERLGSLPATDAEFRAGGLSLAQARHVTEAAVADPQAEARLLEVARREPLTVLREECQRVVAAACEDDEARYRKVHEERYLRTYSNSAGAFRMDISGTPDQGAEVLAALKPIARRLRRQARRKGCKIRKEALMFDALVELARGTDADGKTQRPRYSINLRADRAAWRRGKTLPGETCEVDGAGPIPVSVAQKLVEDGVVNEVGMDGADVVSLVSHSRYIPASVRRALIARDPMCPIPGCYERDDLQFHHWREDFTKSGRTSLDDLCRPCTFHHDLITRGVMSLRGGPGKWEWLPTDWLKRTQARAGPPLLTGV